MHVLTEILHTMKRSLERIRERERRDVIRSEWQLLALVIDRLNLFNTKVLKLFSTQFPGLSINNACVDLTTLPIIP